MRILFDHLAFNQVYGGVSRYFVEVIKRLKAYDVNITLSVKYSNNHFLKSLKPDIQPIMPGFNFKGKPKVERFVGDFFSLLKLGFSKRFDIYHATHYSNYNKPFLSRKTKMVTTIHDMNNWMVPEYYPKINFRQMRQARQMKRCDQIIAVSEQTKKDILKFYPHYESKIEVIYHGVHEIEDLDLAEDLKLPERYILFVGARNPYKNFPRFFEAFVKLQKDNPSIHLVCAGKGFSQGELGLFEKHSLTNHVRHISANDSELRFLYKNASLFVFPSVYEGFGLPCIEAMSAGCPMAVSDVDIFHEVCADSAEYFDPGSVESMYKVLQNALNNQQLRARLRVEMEQRVKLFSWDISVNKHFELYQRLLANA